jgi:hypothetical protein
METAMGEQIVEERPAVEEKPAVMFDADVCKELRISLRTLKRLRRARAFPIPELASLDKRHRYARRDVDAYIARAPQQKGRR